MGRAILTENLTEGQYKIEHRYSSAAILARQTAIDQALADTEQQRVETQAALAAALLHLRALNDLLNGVLSSTTLTLAEKETQSREIVTQQQAQRSVVLGLQTTLGSLAATRTSLQLEYLRLGKVPLTTNRTVWSADYSPDLGSAGIEVGTIEIPGEEQEVLLYPAKNLFRPWTPALDGDLTPVAAQSPMAWLYNTCVVTGWQTYRPTYRFATVVEILNTDHMKVALIDPLTSTYGHVNITPKQADQTLPLYTEVLCEYLDCNTQAFTVGDEVVVQYVDQHPDKPKVIGFRSHPRPCVAITFYLPQQALQYRSKSATWDVRPVVAPKYGNMSWNGKGRAVSWLGMCSRYAMPEVTLQGASQNGFDLSAFVFHKGQAMATPKPVVGAAIGWGFLTIVCATIVTEDAFTPPRVVSEEVFTTPYPLTGPPAWVSRGTLVFSADHAPPSQPTVCAASLTAHWLFSDDGTKAVSVKPYEGEPGTSTMRIVCHLVMAATGAATFAVEPADTRVVLVDEPEVNRYQIARYALDYRGTTLVTLSYEFDLTGASTDAEHLRLRLWEPGGSFALETRNEQFYPLDELVSYNMDGAWLEFLDLSPTAGPIALTRVYALRGLPTNTVTWTATLSQGALAVPIGTQSTHWEPGDTLSLFQSTLVEGSVGEGFSWVATTRTGAAVAVVPQFAATAPAGAAIGFLPSTPTDALTDKTSVGLG